MAKMLHFPIRVMHSVDHLLIQIFLCSVIVKSYPSKRVATASTVDWEQIMAVMPVGIRFILCSYSPVIFSSFQSPVVIVLNALSVSLV